MAKKRSDFKTGATSDEERLVTAKELKEALNAVKALILSEQKGQSLSSSMEDAPRPRIFHKKKEGKREKLATTIDSELFELVKARQQQGQQLSHILDSALWNYFGRPKLSFQDDSDK
jgi:hypothetical protein